MGDVIQFPGMYLSRRKLDKGFPVPVSILKPGKKAYLNLDAEIILRKVEPLVVIRRLDDEQECDIENMIIGDELRELFDVDGCGCISVDAGCIGRNP